MPTTWGGPYKSSNPRTVRGATRKGWHVVEVPRDFGEKHKLSWLGVGMWASRHTRGYFVDSFATRQFAFELEEDASRFIFQFVL
jgi:hypothetical protein